MSFFEIAWFLALVVASSIMIIVIIGIVAIVASTVLGWYF